MDRMIPSREVEGAAVHLENDRRVFGADIAVIVGTAALVVLSWSMAIDNKIKV